MEQAGSKKYSVPLSESQHLHLSRGIKRHQAAVFQIMQHGLATDCQRTFSIHLLCKNVNS